MEKYVSVCSTGEQFTYDVDGVHVLAEFTASCANTGSCNGHGAFIADAGVNVCVIISDGLRYEIGKELAEAIEATHRYSATITPMVSVLRLPSWRLMLSEPKSVRQRSCSSPSK